MDSETRSERTREFTIILVLFILLVIVGAVGYNNGYPGAVSYYQYPVGPGGYYGYGAPPGFGYVGPGYGTFGPGYAPGFGGPPGWGAHYRGYGGAPYPGGPAPNAWW
ncbi:YjcZ family sporulation protein [Camelliibacillus cellulosilyticus]|uniref:YjcZ family sporulation protein n=1 Tax=Camelliibacillus cellulosilyticus TaxID=2174486 RepID=A0ABV9GN21_9BACL